MADLATRSKTLAQKPRITVNTYNIILDSVSLKLFSFVDLVMLPVGNPENTLFVEYPFGEFGNECQISGFTESLASRRSYRGVKESMG